MSMSGKSINAPLFPNHYWGREIYKHNYLPIYVTDEFDFFRCVEFNDTFYGKSVYKLNEGNLRSSNSNNRYSSLFPGQKLSYWADSIETAKKEIKKHGSSDNIITFYAYDDATSTFPIIDNSEPLIIIDGRDVKFHQILKKTEDQIALTKQEKEIIDDIIQLKPDCLAYDSFANPNGVNFLFFEKGFRKLSIKQVRLRLGNFPSKNSNRIVCAVSCDYIPSPKEYGKFFMPLAKIGSDEDYLKSEDFKEKCRVRELSYLRLEKTYYQNRITGFSLTFT